MGSHGSAALVAAEDEAPPPASPALPTGYLGLDVSQAEVVACLLLPDGREAVRRWSVPNSQPGAEALAGRLVALVERHGLARLRIGLESTSLYWWHLACFLATSPLLAGRGVEVYALNPRLVANFKKADTEASKSDRIDASFIAERLRFGRLPAPFQLDALYAPLQRLTRFRVHLVQTLVREKNYFLTFLFLKFSTYGQELPFQDPFGATSLAVLETFTPEELAAASLEDLAAFVQRHGRGHLAAPEEVAAALQRAARAAYRLDRPLVGPVDTVLGVTLATIRTLTAQLQALDKTIARELEAVPADRRTLASVPGLGPVWTAGLVAEVGDIRRFENEAALAKSAGLVWKQSQSGGYTADDTPLTKAGNAYLRYYLVEAANSVRLHCAEYRAYYQAKAVQSSTHAHKRALVLTARKLVRLVDTLLRMGMLYRPPASRQDRKEAHTPPHAARPGPVRPRRPATPR